MSQRQKIMLGVAAVLAVVAVVRYVTYDGAGGASGKDYEKRISQLEADGDVSGLAAEVDGTHLEAARMALAALGRIGTPEATAHIARALGGDKRPAVRTAAAAVIGRARVFREMDALLTAVAEDDELAVRVAADRAVSDIFGRKQVVDLKASKADRRAAVEQLRETWASHKEGIIRFYEAKRKQRR